MLTIRQKGTCDYAVTDHEMQTFTKERQTNTPDECWVLEHFPVYTQGTNCRQIPKIEQSTIPILRSNRGGQITYHAPGQLVVYCLLNIKRMGVGPRLLVEKCQKLVIELLSQYDTQAYAKKSVPGVYVENRKIAFLGFRISKGCCYHGFSINLDMDLTPFEWIDPCGYKGLEITQLSDYVDNIQKPVVVDQITALLSKYFDYDTQ